MSLNFSVCQIADEKRTKSGSKADEKRMKVLIAVFNVIKNAHQPVSQLEGAVKYDIMSYLMCGKSHISHRRNRLSTRHPQ